MNKLISIILLVFSSYLYSQNIIINGKIINSSNNKPLQYANIFIKGTNIGTVSNIEGKFHLFINEKFKKDTIIFSHIGYVNTKLAINDIKSDILIKLNPYIEQTENIIIEAKRTNPSDILKKAMQNLDENVYDKTYKTKVFSRNFVQKDSVFILYRKTLTNATSYKDDVWSREGDILADKYFSVKKNIPQIIKNNRVDIFDVIAESFDLPRYFSEKAISNIPKNIVKIDTVIISKNQKIYVIDYFGKSVNSKTLPYIYRFMNNNPSPYTVIFNKKSQNDIIKIFDINNKEFLFFTRYYIDAKQNYNIIKSISFDIHWSMNSITMIKNHLVEYKIAYYTNTINKSIFNHSISYRKLLYKQNEMYSYYDFSSLFEQFCYEPDFNINDGDTTETKLNDWSNTISYKYNDVTHWGTSNVSFDKWDGAESFIKTDTLEEKAVDQILYPEKYYDVEKFYAKLDSANNIKIKREKREKPKVEIPISITGTISDSISYEPLPYCNIIIRNTEDTTKKIIGAITNEDGEFKLDIPLGYKYFLQISQLGYKTISDTIDLYVDSRDLEYYQDLDEEIDVKNIELVPETNLLETVTIKGETKELDIDKQSVIITPEMRQNTIAARDLFNKVDGISFNKITEDLKVDGSNKVKLLVDGVEKSSDYILNLNPKRVKKIEILRNISGLYATEGYTSVVNIITYDNYRGYDFTINDQFLNNIHSESCPYFLQNNASLNINISRDKWNYYVKANNYYNKINLLTRSVTNFTANNETIINGNNQTPNNFDFSNKYGINLGFDYKINKKHLLGAEIGFSGFPALNNTKTISFDTLSINNSTSIIQNTTKRNSTYNEFSGNLYYNFKINPTSNFITYLYLINRQTVSNQSINNNQELNYNQYSNNTNYKLEYNKTFKNKYTITAGGRYLSNDFKSISQNNIQNNFTNAFSKFSAYTYLKTQFNKNTGLLIGTSYEDYTSENSDLKTSFNSFQPKINLYKTINKNHKFVLEYSIKTEYPYLSDMNPQINYITPFIASVGNPELKPYLYHDISFQYSKISDGFFSYLSIKPYYNYSDNEMGVSSLTNDSIIIYQNKNFVKHEKYGVYTSLSFDINKKFTMDFDCDIYKDWNKNLNTPNIIDWNGYAQITYTLNTKYFFGLMYQKEYAKNVTSLGSTKSGSNYFMLYLMTLQLKGRLQFMLGYSLPLLSNQINEDYAETPYYVKNNYTDVSFINNMIMINLVFRLSKGSVLKNNNSIDYEDYEKRENNKIGLY